LYPMPGLNSVLPVIGPPEIVFPLLIFEHVVLSWKYPDPFNPPARSRKICCPGVIGTIRLVPVSVPYEINRWRADHAATMLCDRGSNVSRRSFGYRSSRLAETVGIQLVNRAFHIGIVVLALAIPISVAVPLAVALAERERGRGTIRPKAHVHL